MSKKTVWDIENKILIPFVTITIVATMVFAAILYYSGYNLKLEKEKMTAKSLVLNIEHDLNVLFGRVKEEAVLKKYKDLGYPEIFFIDKRGRILLFGRMLSEEGLPNESIIASSKNNPFDWEICYSIDMVKFQNDLIEEQKYMILATIALLVIIVQASIFIAHNISEPIRQLNLACREISENPTGFYGKTLQYSQRRDEIGQLSSSFQSMIDSINTHTTEINEVKLLNESIISNLPIGIIAFDENKNILCINPKAQQLVSNESYRARGATLAQILERLVNDNSLLHDPIHFVNDEGKIRELEIGVWRLERSSNARYGLICTLDDITYKKMMEEKISENEKLAYTGTLAASLAHEIRNPLAGIRASIQVITKRLEQPTDRQLCSHIVGEVDRVNILIEDLLNLSRKRESQKKILDISSLFDELVLLYSKVAENSRVQFDISTDSFVSLYADEGELKQILINLINNSIRAMPNGGKITLSASMQDGCPLLSVADTGCGLTQDEVDAILSRRSGSGLGLSIVAKLLRQNNGDFFIQSTPNEGTVITITFKRQDLI